MSEGTPTGTLVNVLDDIVKNQRLIDELIVLSEKLKSFNTKCPEDVVIGENVEKAKSIVDELNENITWHRNKFHKLYDNWKNIGDDHNTRDEDSAKSAPVIDDSFSGLDDIVNSTVLSDKSGEMVDTEKLKSVRNGLVKSNGELNNVSDNSISEDGVGSENGANTLNLNQNEQSKNGDDVEKDKDDGDSNDTISDSGNTGNTSTKDDEILNGTDLEQNKPNLDVSSTNLGIEETKDKDEGTKLISNQGNEDKGDNDRGGLCSIADTSGHDKADGLSCENEENPLTTDPQTSTTKEVDLHPTETDNETAHKGTELDPLHIDNNLFKDDSDPKHEENYTLAEGILEPKKENAFKIKCVDIKKLLEVTPKSPRISTGALSTTNKKSKSLNSSVVVISDSDSEVSPRKYNRRSKASDVIPNLGKEITMVRVEAQKKVIVLDDSDSSEDENLSSVKNKLKSPKGRTRRRIRKSSIENSKSVEATKGTGRQLRKRPVKNLADVSSLSENTTSTSDDSHSEIALSKKRNRGKTDRKVISPVEDCLKSDKKAFCKTYVPLMRIPAEKLKENYEKQLAKTEIRKLTNMDTLKRSRRKNSSSSRQSTESDDAKAKKRHCSVGNKNRSKYNISSSDESDVSMHEDTQNVSKEVISEEMAEDPKLPDPQLPDPKEAEREIERALLDEIRSDNDKSKDSSDSDSAGSVGKNQSEKGEESKKEETETVKDKVPTDTEKEGEKSDKKAEDEGVKEKRKWRQDKLLTENITESDSEEDFAKFSKKRDEMKAKDRYKKKRGKYVLGSSSEGESSPTARSRSNSREKDVDKPSGSGKSESEDKETRKPDRKRIKQLKDSSDEDETDKATRKQIRRVWNKNSLSESTIAAEKEERERKTRIAERQKKYNLIFEPDSLEKATVDKVVLDFDEETKQELLKVDQELVKHFKPHQGKGIQFMWDTCFESLERAKSTKGSGCILAHCMGLGKTLQVIALIHTLLTNEEKTGVRKVVVVCPLSTVLNWVDEFKKWLPDEDDEVQVFELVSFKQNIGRAFQVKEWDRVGGVLILGYDMFRNLTNPTNNRLTKKMRKTFQTCLVDPGPQLVICDEGHLLKNEKTSISIAMNRLNSMRRIVLTGTPLQNNLKEYFCMVQFVKPNLLGTYKEYLNRFVNPITNGQYTDSTQHDIDVMRKRSHVLHKLLDGIVQRKDYSVLEPYLPPKHEYVLFISLTELQIKLYQHYMREKLARTDAENNRSYLFVDYNEFQRICTHPRVLLDKSNKVKETKDKDDFLDNESEGSLKDFIDDDDTDRASSTPESSSDSESGSDGSHKATKKAAPSRKQRITRANAGLYVVSDKEKSDVEPEPDPSEWWREYCTDEDLDNLCHSGKLTLLFEILRQCELIGDKVLIFSQSLYSLSIIEYFLNKIDEATQTSETNSFCGFSGSWALGLDYFRLDGTSSCDNRAAWCKTFNNPENIRARLFLISTKAGGLGINLVAANRVIIFDVSWNPSYDTQSIYRIYRFGQNKPCYIYRFVSLGAMEMKIYERQVTKQAISKRVIDEQQIDRHYNQSDLTELYKFRPEPEEERPIPLVPKDVLLGELLQADKKIYKYHEHQSLLENKVDEVLDEAERTAAWEEFENEKTARQMQGTIAGYSLNSIAIGLNSLIQKENPTWTPNQIQKEMQEMYKQMQIELKEGNSDILQKAVTQFRVHRALQEQQHYWMEQRALLNQYRQQHELLMQQRGQQLNPFNFAQMNQMNNARLMYPQQRAPSPSGIANMVTGVRRAHRGDKPIDFIDLND